jgi:hypothetical protein
LKSWLDWFGPAVIIGDEYHFLLVCKNDNIITLRNKYLPNYYRAYPNHAKFEGLLSITMKNNKSNSKYNINLQHNTGSYI